MSLRCTFFDFFFHLHFVLMHLSLNPVTSFPCCSRFCNITVTILLVQVRSFGPINQLTRQPIKGRKQGGGIRFGEMERDSLLAHGAAYLLHDRLHACSDYSVMDVCTRCGSVLSPMTKPQAVAGLPPGAREGVKGMAGGKVVCKLCEGSSKYVDRVALPYVFKYLAAELAAMNIKVSLGVK
jgi:DNA-directed RNA polymerase I subunit RPA2